MKKITMSKVGVGTVVLTHDSGKYLFNNGVVTIDLGSAEKLNGTYLAYRKAGYVVKTESSDKKAVAAPREKLGPSWDFGPDGFDYAKYMEVARDNGLTFLNVRSGRVMVRKADREKVYELMGATRIR